MCMQDKNLSYVMLSLNLTLFVYERGQFHQVILNCNLPGIVPITCTNYTVQFTESMKNKKNVAGNSSLSFTGRNKFCRCLNRACTVVIFEERMNRNSSPVAICSNLGEKKLFSNDKMRHSGGAREGLGGLQPRLMTTSPLYPCGKPCSRGTHNEIVKNPALSPAFDRSNQDRTSAVALFNGHSSERKCDKNQVK